MKTSGKEFDRKGAIDETPANLASVMLALTVERLQKYAPVEFEMNFSDGSSFKIPLKITGDVAALDTVIHVNPNSKIVRLRLAENKIRDTIALYAGVQVEVVLHVERIDLYYGTATSFYVTPYPMGRPKGMELVYFGARYYDAELGLWTSVEPESEPQDWGLYTYASNNPINKFDPNGRWVETVLDVASLGQDLLDFKNDPSIENAGLVLWSAASIALPGVPGSWAGKAVKYGGEGVAKITTKAGAEVVEASVEKIGKETIEQGVEKIGKESIQEGGERLTKVADGSAAKRGDDLHRPYVRKQTRETVESRARKTADGKFRDANTGKPVEGKYDLGHKKGHEFRREKVKAETEGLTQKEFNDRMNNPDLYQIEDPLLNRSHKFEKPGNN